MLVYIFDQNYGNMGFHGYQIENIVPILLVKNVLLTFQMEQKGMFRGNFNYDYWILHTKIFG